MNRKIKLLFTIGFLLFTFPILCQAVEPQAPKPLVILKFSAKWCSSCIKMNSNWHTKEVQALLKERKIQLFEIDIDNDSESARMWKVRSVPCVILARLSKNGEAAEIKRFIGYKAEQEIIKWLNTK